MRYGPEFAGLAGELRVDPAQFGHPALADQHTVDLVEEVVAGGAFDGPLLAQKLARLEDLLADDPGFGCLVAQAAKVFERIAQAVGMVHAHAIEHAAAQPLEDERVGFFEDVLALDPHADERVHIEKAAVAELLIGGLPVGQTVILLI